MSETEPNSEPQPDDGPTIEELIAACSEVLTPEDMEDLQNMEVDEAIGYLMFLLPERGEDAEEFLKAKGLVESFETSEDQEIETE